MNRLSLRAAPCTITFKQVEKDRLAALPIRSPKSPFRPCRRSASFCSSLYLHLLFLCALCGKQLFLHFAALCALCGVHFFRQAPRPPPSASAPPRPRPTPPPTPHAPAARDSLTPATKRIRVHQPQGRSGTNRQEARDPRRPAATSGKPYILHRSPPRRPIDQDRSLRRPPCRDCPRSDLARQT